MLPLPAVLGLARLPRAGLGPVGKIVAFGGIVAGGQSGLGVVPPALIAGEEGVGVGGTAVGGPVVAVLL